VFLFGVPGAILLYGIVSLEMAGEVKTPRFMSFIGDLSYSLYLWHMVVLNLFLLWWPFPVITATQITGFLSAAVVVIMLVSVASFYIIEMPSNYLGRVINLAT
jgi:peptidoglycan/LPS O-acetylase OafA/YrhL